MEEKALHLKAEVLKALAQPTRLKILELLRQGERCICEIIPAINGEQSNISRHIALMQKSHLITTRKDGVKVMVKVRGSPDLRHPGSGQRDLEKADAGTKKTDCAIVIFWKGKIHDQIFCRPSWFITGWEFSLEPCWEKPWTFSSMTL